MHSSCAERGSRYCPYQCLKQAKVSKAYCCKGIEPLQDQHKLPNGRLYEFGTKGHTYMLRYVAKKRCWGRDGWAETHFVGLDTPPLVMMNSLHVAHRATTRTNQL